jgi:hypothetical protein
VIISAGNSHLGSPQRFMGLCSLSVFSLPTWLLTGFRYKETGKFIDHFFLLY